MVIRCTNILYSIEFILRIVLEKGSINNVICDNED